jgi:hypothetical protein
VTGQAMSANGNASAGRYASSWCSKSKSELYGCSEGYAEQKTQVLPSKLLAINYQ